MEPLTLVRIAVSILDELGIDYLVTGSMASTAYGEARLTNDVDIAIRATPELAAALAAAFKEPDFYASAAAARTAAQQGGGQFNVIHPSSGFKIDFMVVANDEFDQSRFQRARYVRLQSETTTAYASPEDVILRKLQYCRDGGSDKHVRDIRSMVSLIGDGLDLAYIESWLDRLGVRDQWRTVTLS